MFRLRFFTVFFLYSYFASAQHSPYIFRQITVKDGLSNNRVNCILQDHLGFTWIGTDDGLNRFDGNAFTIFRHEPGNSATLGGNIILDLCEDKNGVLWIATGDGGLCRFNRSAAPSRQFKNFRHNPGDSASIPVNTINAMLPDGKQFIWLATSGSGILRFNTITNEFIRIGGLPRTTITDLCFDKFGMIWAGTQGGGYIKLDPGSQRIWFDEKYSNPYDKLPHVAVTNLYKDKRNNIWLASWDPVLYQVGVPDQNKQGVHTTIIGKLEPGNEPTSFTDAGSSDFWVGTKKSGIRIFRSSENRWEEIKAQADDFSSLGSNTVYCLYRDKDEHIWIGTDKGISLYIPTGSQLSPVRLPDVAGTGNQQVHDFLSLTDKKIWIGTNDGLYEWQNNRLNYIPLRWKNKRLAATSLFHSANGKRYIGTDYSLFEWDSQTQKIKLLPNTDKDIVMKQLIASRIVSIEEDSIDGSAAIIASPYGHFLTYYNNAKSRWISRFDTVTRIVPDFQIKDNLIHKIYKDPAGHLWLATTKNGLGEWIRSKKQFEYHINHPGNPSSITNNHVNDIIADSSGKIWLATYGGGLNKYDPVSSIFTYIRNSPNLLESLCVDNKQRIWMLGNGELFAYDPTSDQIRSFANALGVNRGQLCGWLKVDPDGYLLIGGKDFFIRVHPDSLQQPVVHPSVQFTDLQVFDTSFYHQLSSSQRIRLAHNQNYLSIHYSAPWYRQKLYYQYKLEGVDPGWIDAGTQQKTAYQQLAPGTYRFLVRSSSIPGIWNSNPSILIIELVPPFWQRWWFFVILTAAISALIYVIYRYRINELVKRQTIRNRIAQDLHDNLGSTLSSISVYSQVAKIYKEQQKDTELNDTLQRIGSTSGEMISEMNDIVWAINPRNDNMEKIIQRMDSFARPLLKAACISFDLQHSPDIKPIVLEMEQRKNLYLIFKESVTNAIKYSEASEMQVNIARNGKFLIMDIKDNGKGFDPALNKNANRLSLSGNGLRNMRNRAKELNGKLIIDSAPGQGTSLQFSFPFT
ncbi:ligand-binding sensor domain-containing protein [Flavihumibacter sp. UBA7668]|uniref:ligand-binding sensor domain-containing protein n=1 Tax=Flavihumibacter sp. UBA7668 TaxID=1946542 RepID=UPI0025C5E8F2|nr:sensor histidine kinase [Flavihumibacter sp. UBA7668]